MAQKTDLKFQIKGVELINIELTQPSKILPPGVVFNFNVSVKHKVNPQNKLILVLVGVDINEKDKKKLLAKILVNCVYSIENFDNVVQEKKTKKYSIPNEVIDSLNSISVSTARGVMATIFKGTVLHNAILPLINPKDFKKPETPVES